MNQESQEEISPTEDEYTLAALLVLLAGFRPDQAAEIIRRDAYDRRR
jgi:hypothetical protein